MVVLIVIHCRHNYTDDGKSTVEVLHVAVD
jgi:hypothetical protein